MYVIKGRYFLEWFVREVVFWVIVIGMVEVIFKLLVIVLVFVNVGLGYDICKFYDFILCLIIFK